MTCLLWRIFSAHPSPSLPSAPARRRRSFSIPFPLRIRVSQRSGERRMDGCPKKLCANCMGMGELASWLRSNVPQRGKFPSSRCAFFFLIGNPLRNSGTNFGFPETSLCSEVNTVLVITNAVEISVLCHRTLSLIHQPCT